ncbi:hypothetical protein DRN74_00415 [Candidatus Micrarchaeota archaeon]|nr:MAG: hypothetical protein DRN74_00415 [Candidatus Micrarchaeota archaeon]
MYEKIVFIFLFITIAFSTSYASVLPSYVDILAKPYCTIVQNPSVLYINGNPGNARSGIITFSSHGPCLNPSVINLSTSSPGWGPITLNQSNLTISAGEEKNISYSFTVPDVGNWIGYIYGNESRPGGNRTNTTIYVTSTAPSPPSGGGGGGGGAAAPSKPKYAVKIVSIIPSTVTVNSGEAFQTVVSVENIGKKNLSSLIFNIQNLPYGWEGDSINVGDLAVGEKKDFKVYIRSYPTAKGNYTLLFYVGNDEAEDTDEMHVIVKESKVPNVQIEIKTDKEKYVANESMKINITFKNIAAVAVEDGNITVSFADEVIRQLKHITLRQDGQLFLPITHKAGESGRKEIKACIADETSGYKSCALKSIEILENPMPVISKHALKEINGTVSKVIVTITISNKWKAFRNISVVDNIPKSLAHSADEIHFITTYNSIINPDPTVLWLIDSLEPWQTAVIGYEIKRPTEEILGIESLPAVNVSLFDPVEGRKVFTNATAIISVEYTGIVTVCYPNRDLPLLIMSVIILLILLGLKVFKFHTYYELIIPIPLFVSILLILMNTCMFWAFLIVLVASVIFLVYQIILKYVMHKEKPDEIIRKYNEYMEAVGKLERLRREYEEQIQSAIEAVKKAKQKQIDETRIKALLESSGFTKDEIERILSEANK